MKLLRIAKNWLLSNAGVFISYLILGIIFLLIFTPDSGSVDSLKDRLEFSNILNIIYLGLALFFGYLNYCYNSNY